MYDYRYTISFICSKLIYNNRVNLHIRSLIIMLAAKVAGVPKKHHSHSEDVSIILSK